MEFIKTSLYRRIINYIKMESANIFFTIRKGYFRLLYYYILAKIRYFLDVKGNTKCKKITIKDLTIEIPNSVHTFGVIIEVFMIELYKQLQGGKCVLDLGGFIGDSSLYLAKYNEKVIVFESNPEHYKTLEKNCAQKNNIYTFNGAITKDEKKTLFLNNRSDIDSCNQTGETGEIKIPTFDIASIMRDFKPDIFKMDIEGGEYDILQYFYENNDTFNFKKGIIEFHFFKDKEQEERKKLARFLNFLKENHYSYHMFNNSKRTIKQAAIDKSRVIAINIFFSKT